MKALKVKGPESSSHKAMGINSELHLRLQDVGYVRVMDYVLRRFEYREWKEPKSELYPIVSKIGGTVIVSHMLLDMGLENLFFSCCILVFISTSISSLFSHSLIFEQECILRAIVLYVCNSLYYFKECYT